MRSNSSVINVYKKNNIKSEVVTQLLYGDTFKKIKKRGSWIKIKNDLDHYKGFIKNKKFPSNQKDTHKICKLYANLYFQPNLKSKIKNHKDLILFFKSFLLFASSRNFLFFLVSTIELVKASTSKA